MPQRYKMINIKKGTQPSYKMAMHIQTTENSLNSLSRSATGRTFSSKTDADGRWGNTMQQDLAMSVATANTRFDPELPFSR